MDILFALCDKFLFHNNKGFFSYTDDSTSYYLGKSSEEVITKLEESSETIFGCTKNLALDLLKSYLFLNEAFCDR